MQLRKFSFKQAASGPVALTIGNFDSVHRGHLGLLDQLKEQSRQVQLPSAVLTFEPHPREFLTPHSAPQRLSSLRDKLLRLRAAGVDQVYVARFDRQLAELDAQTFVEKVLVDKIRSRQILIGDDFCFGKQRRGNLQLLQQQGDIHGFSVSSMDTLLLEGERISSTRVRDALSKGNIPLAEELLGGRYAVSCKISAISVAGDGYGRQLELCLDQHSIPLGGSHEIELLDAYGRGIHALARMSPRTLTPLGEKLRIRVVSNEDISGWHVGLRLQLTFRRRQQDNGLAHSLTAHVHSAALSYLQGQPG